MAVGRGVGSSPPQPASQQEQDGEPPHAADRTLDGVPEGDTIHYAANRIRPILEGHVPDELRPLHPRFARDRWPERLAGRAVRSVDARGKHLFLRFEGGLTIHSHLRMTGWWQTGRSAPQWRRSPRRAWLVLRRGDQEVVQFDGPVLELMTDSRTRIDQRFAGLGPDIVAADPFDEARFLRRLREDDPTRPIGDALLDQKIVAGLGTVWRSEACWRGASSIPGGDGRRRRRRRGAGGSSSRVRPADAAVRAGAASRPGDQRLQPRRAAHARAAAP